MSDPGRTATGQLGEYGYAGKSERPASEIVKDMMERGQDIIRAEVRLAKIELRDEGEKALQAGSVTMVAAVFGMFALGFALLCILFALELVIPAWAAALIVAFLAVIPAGTLAAIGRDRWRRMKLPAKTIQGAKEIVNG
jgi:uncharacterized membrane protein YqjE